MKFASYEIIGEAFKRGQGGFKNSYPKDDFLAYTEKRGLEYPWTEYNNSVFSKIKSDYLQEQKTKRTNQQALNKRIVNSN